MAQLGRHFLVGVLPIDELEVFGWENPRGQRVQVLRRLSVRALAFMYPFDDTKPRDPGVFGPSLDVTHSLSRLLRVVGRVWRCLAGSKIPLRGARSIAL